jgi:serine/threonine protein kinase
MLTTFLSYTNLHQIADKGWCTIYKAIDPATRTPVVLKVTSDFPEALENESAILSTVSHPSIMKPSQFIRSGNQTALVLPYAAGGDLFDTISSSALSEDTAKRVFYNIASGLVELHRQNIRHLDIKPENILIITPEFDPTATVLADFETGCKSDSPSSCDVDIGTEFYRAPELITHGRYTEKVDIWALGITLFVALTKKFPFHSEDFEKEIIAGLPNLADDMRNFSPQCRQLARGMLRANPNERLTAAEVLAHSWFDDVRPPMTPGRSMDAHRRKPRIHTGAAFRRYQTS